jgi:hypothetical protein
MALQGLFGFPRAPARPAADADTVQGGFLAAVRDERVIAGLGVAAGLAVVVLMAVLMASVGP